MELELDDAIRLRAKTMQQQKEFDLRCNAGEKAMKEDQDNIIEILQNILANGKADAYKLLSGEYLYMKESSNPRKLNEERIGAAVDRVDYDYLRCLMDDPDRDQQPSTLLQLVCEALMETITTECVNITRKPNIAKKRPDSLEPSSLVMPASADIEDHAVEFNRIKSALSDIRKHKRLGKKRCADVNELTNPVIKKYMEKVGVETKVFRLIPKESEAAEVLKERESKPEPEPAPDIILPQLPTVLPEHEEDNKTVVTTVSTPTTVKMVTTDSNTPTSLKFQTPRQKSSRTKAQAPKVKEFTEHLPECASKIIDSKTKITDDNIRSIVVKEKKIELLKAMLELYSKMFQEKQKEKEKDEKDEKDQDKPIKLLAKYTRD